MTISKKTITLKMNKKGKRCLLVYRLLIYLDHVAKRVKKIVFSVGIQVDTPNPSTNRPSKLRGFFYLEGLFLFIGVLLRQTTINRLYGYLTNTSGKEVKQEKPTLLRVYLAFGRPLRRNTSLHLLRK